VLEIGLKLLVVPVLWYGLGISYFILLLVAVVVVQGFSSFFE